MKKQLAILLVAPLLFAACGRNKGKETTSTTSQIIPPANTDSVSSRMIIDPAGNRLFLDYNKSQGTLTATIDGKTIIMRQDSMTSGMNASNERYRYTESNGHVKLERDGQVVFENSSELSPLSVRDKAGNPMTVTFDADQHTATVTLKDTALTLQEQRAPSGMLYKDAYHELRIDGGDNIQLSRGGQTVFQSE